MKEFCVWKSGITGLLGIRYVYLTTTAGGSNTLNAKERITVRGAKNIGRGNTGKRGMYERNEAIEEAARTGTLYPINIRGVPWKVTNVTYAVDHSDDLASKQLRVNIDLELA